MKIQTVSLEMPGVPLPEMNRRLRNYLNLKPDDHIHPVVRVDYLGANQRSMLANLDTWWGEPDAAPLNHKSGLFVLDRPFRVGEAERFAKKQIHLLPACSMNHIGVAMIPPMNSSERITVVKIIAPGGQTSGIEEDTNQLLRGFYDSNKAPAARLDLRLRDMPFKPRNTGQVLSRLSLAARSLV